MSHMKDSVVLFVAPSINNSYYREFFEDIFLFYERFIAHSHPLDTPLVVVDQATQKHIGARILPQNLLTGSIPDIWIRDFAPIRTVKGTFDFCYRPNYHSQSAAESIEVGFQRWFSATNIENERMSLILDGGNLNYNGLDQAVTTTRILQDNPSYSERAIAELLKHQLGLTHLAIIPQEPGDVTGHSDGMVKWLSEERLGVAHFDEPLRSQVLTKLAEGLGHNVELIELPHVPQEELWQEWPSAKGVYVNALTTDNAIYIPQFGLAEDTTAVELYNQYATKTVIPIQTGLEVILGGTIRCLSWQVNGPDARLLLENCS